MKKYFTTGEVAKLCGLAIRTVQLYCNKGIFETVQSSVTRHRRITRKSLIQFMTEHGIEESKLNALEMKRVMIIDDDVNFTKMLSIAIQKQFSKCEVNMVHDGYTGLIEVSSSLPDVVIIDIRLPKIDGIELCRRLKNNPKTKWVKIIAVTAYNKEGYGQEIRSMGAVRCFYKPLNLNSFLNYVKRTLYGRQTTKMIKAKWDISSVNPVQEAEEV